MRKARTMTADELIKELSKVAPADAGEWRDLRVAQIEALQPNDNARVYGEWRKIARINGTLR